MNYGYIYETINNINGKVYIGQKKGKYNPRYLGSGKILKDAIKKYGKDKFSNTVICWCDAKEALDEMEKYWIKQYRSQDDRIGYNLTDGGDGGCGHTPTLETRKKLSRSMLGRKFSEESLKKMSEAQKGKKVSEETRKKLSELNKGKKLSKEVIEQITIRMQGGNKGSFKKGLVPWNKGIPCSEELKTKLSKINKGRKQSKEAIQKIIKAQTGRPLSEEHKNNISKSLKEYYKKRNNKLTNE